MIKNILIKGELSGRGIVNFDSKEQSKTLTRHGIFPFMKDNVKLAKKAFLKTGKFKEDENGKTEIYDYKIKISSETLRRAIFGQDVEYANGYITQNPFILATYLLSHVGFMRGFMFPCRDLELKRKSALTITDAIQCNNVKSELEVGSTAGDTTIDEDGKVVRKDTSLFYTEKVGDIKYQFSGQIDIKQLQFMSADPRLDRMAIKSDWYDSGEVDVIMANHYGKKAKYDYGIFSSMAKFTGNSYGETGILIGNDICEYIIKATLKNILAININKNNSYAATTGLKIKIVENIIGIGQKVDDEEGWIELKTEADVDKLNLKDLCVFYEKASEEEVKERERMIKAYDKLESSRKEKKATEKEEKKNKVKNATSKK